MIQLERKNTSIELSIILTLSILINLLTPFLAWPGLSILNLIMIPVLIIAYSRERISDATVGFILGVFLPVDFLVHPLDVVYVYPFVLLLLLIIERVKRFHMYKHKDQRYSIAIALLEGGLVRFLFSVVSGYLYISELAPQNKSVLTYSVFFFVGEVIAKLSTIYISVIVIILLFLPIIRWFPKR